MNEPEYLIMNPLQIVLFHTKKKYKKRTEIEERFYNKMEELKNINLQNKKILQICNIKKIEL